MAKKPQRGLSNRIRELLEALDRLLNPPKPIPVRVPSRPRLR